MIDKHKKHRYAAPTSVIETQNVTEFVNRTGNIYESIAIISKRADQISSEIKEELSGKLKEFSTHTDNLEEVHENREQIEMSRFYEKLPHPTIVSVSEFVNRELEHRYPSEDDDDTIA